MKVAVIGAGNVGRALGGGWRATHDVRYGVRDPSRYQDLGAGIPEEAARDADVIVLCTPWQGTRDAITACGDIAGKVLIDCTNPLTPDFATLEVGHTDSGAEQVARWAPGARVTKAMNQIGAPMMDNPSLPQAPVMFICGDDEDAKSVTAELVAELGFEPTDAGALDVARLLEPYALLWIHLALRRGFGTDFGFGLLRS